MLFVATERLQNKCLNSAGLRGWPGGDWDLHRVPLKETIKHRSIVAHFVNGVPWIDTPLFRESYSVRFGLGDSPRGARDLEHLAELYEEEIGALFESLKRDGFRTDLSLPAFLIGRKGEVMLGNQGNHRVALAKIIGIDKIPGAIQCQHALRRKRKG